MDRKPGDKIKSMTSKSKYKSPVCNYMRKNCPFGEHPQKSNICLKELCGSKKNDTDDRVRIHFPEAKLKQVILCLLETLEWKN